MASRVTDMGASDLSGGLAAHDMDAPDSLTESSQLSIDASLGQRLADAKARLDRLEQQPGSRDDVAMATARVEFALASRALADDLLLRRGSPGGSD